MGGNVLPAARGDIKELRKPAAAVTFEDREPIYLISTRPARTGSDRRHPGRREHVDDDLHRGADEHRGGAVGLLGRPMVSGIWSSSGVTGGTSPHRNRASSTRACARDSGSRQRRRSTGAASRATPGAKAVGRAAGVRSTTALLRPRSAGLIGNGSRIVGPAVWNPSSDTWEALVAQLSDIQPAGEHMMAAQFKAASERVQVEIRATEAEIGRRSAGSALAGSLN